MLVVVKGLFALNTIENILMKQFGLWKDPQLVFPSCRTLIKEVFPCMVKHTLEEFVLLYINVVISITTIIDLWMSKGALDIFALVINFITLYWEPKHVTIGLFKAKDTIGIILLVNFKFCLKNTTWVTKLSVVWKMRARICLQWQMFLNKLLVMKDWGY